MPSLPNLHHHYASKSWPPFQLPSPLTSRPSSKCLSIKSSERNVKVSSGASTNNTKKITSTATSNAAADASTPNKTSIDDNPFAWFLTPPSTPSASSDSDLDSDDEEEFIFGDATPAGITIPSTTTSKRPKPKLLSQPPKSRSLSPLRQLLVRRWLHSRQNSSPAAPSSPPISPRLTPLSLSTSPPRATPRGRERHREAVARVAQQYHQPARHREPQDGRRSQSARSSASGYRHAWREPSTALWTVLEEEGAGREEHLHRPVDDIDAVAMGSHLSSGTDDEAEDEKEDEEYDDEDGDIDEEMMLDDAEDEELYSDNNRMPMTMSGRSRL
ncbi:MAG: hypothetical protein M1837_004023 [Sclerophora amabilis]|nr:MAG: hypothetical protein M1837_004023 [Sclerophora amabilis]